MDSDPEAPEAVLRSPGVPDEVIASAGRRGDLFLTLADRDELLAIQPVVQRCAEFDWEHCGSERVRGERH